MMNGKLQEYKITLIRTNQGDWILRGYWERRGLNKYYEESGWDLDGKALSFKTRKEALEHLMKVSGVPE